MTRPSDERFSHLSGKKVLVTGGTGFVGRHLLPRLLAAGAHVTCLTRAASRTGHLPADVAVARADLHTGEGLAEALAGQDVVIHMAALLFGLGWPGLSAGQRAGRALSGRGAGRRGGRGSRLRQGLARAFRAGFQSWRPPALPTARRPWRTRPCPRRFPPTAGPSCWWSRFWAGPWGQAGDPASAHYLRLRRQGPAARFQGRGQGLCREPRSVPRFSRVRRARAGHGSGRAALLQGYGCGAYTISTTAACTAWPISAASWARPWAVPGCA